MTKPYTKLFEYDDVELIIEQDALKEIAKKTIIQKTGARGLRSIVEGILMNVMFKVPSENDVNKIIITTDCVINNTDPIIEHGKKKITKKMQNFA